MPNLKTVWNGFKKLSTREKFHALYLVPGFYLWAFSMLALAFIACVLKMPYDVIYGAKWYRKHCPPVMLSDCGLLGDYRKN